MGDSINVRDIYRSLNSGENKFDFSQLQEALRESGVDVENFHLEQDNDQQALLCVAEKFLLDVQKEEGGTIQFPDPLTGKPMIEIKIDSNPEIVKIDFPDPITGKPFEKSDLRTRILQPALLFEPQTTVDEGYWQQWERAFNRSLVRLYSKSQKISVLSEKRELNLC